MSMGPLTPGRGRAPAAAPGVRGGPGRLDNEHPALRRCWHPLALSAEVTAKPQRFWLVGQPWVAVRLPTGLAVFADRCPHRLAPLSAGSVVDGELQCAYHGWRFGCDGRASCIPSANAGAAIPPKARAGRPFATVEKGGMVFVAIDEPIVALPDWDLAPDAATRVFEMGPYQGRFGAAMLIDNQIDVTHFAFLHRGTFGNHEAERPGDYDVERQPWGFAVNLSVPINAANDPGVASNIRPLRQYRHMHYRYQAPFHLTLKLTYPVMGGTNYIVFWAQPQRADSCRLYVTMYLRQPGGFTDAELAHRMAFEERVIQEDLDLQARFDDIGLPLSMAAECHVRSDAASIEYRRLLQALVAAADGQAGTDGAHGQGADFVAVGARRQASR